jgi:branched-chain amino acid transport system ATP-binding protein
MTCLQVERLTIRFGGLLAVDDVRFSVAANCIHSLIGPNGAGKTTLINSITGLCPPSHGSIRFRGQELVGMPPHRIAAAGVGRTFQNIELFPEMTAFENVLVGAHCGARYGSVSAMLRLPRFTAGERLMLQRAEKALEMAGIADEAEKPAASLSFGRQRLLGLARSLAGDPQLLLLDEPAAGLRAGEIEELNRRLKALRDRHGLTILLVDHVMQMVMNISDRVTVLNFGKKIAEGTVAVVRSDPEVQRAYLGSDADLAGGS